LAQLSSSPSKQTATNIIACCLTPNLIKCGLHTIQQSCLQPLFAPASLVWIDTVLKLGQTVGWAGHINIVNLTALPILATTTKGDSLTLNLSAKEMGFEHKSPSNPANETK
jgi:hypothetical protein